VSESSPGPDEAAEETTEETTEEDKQEDKARDPVRLVTLVVLAVCLVFFLLYIRADRVMPYSDQARVVGYSVPVVPMVSGYVTDIGVDLHQVVDPGQVLVQIDTIPSQIALRSARAALDNAIQQLGVQSEAVESAAAKLAADRAQESIARQDAERIRQISDRSPNALSQADRDRSTAALSQAEAQVAASLAEVRRAEAQLGVKGEINPAVRSAMAALEQAEFNLARTVVRAPSRGVIESLSLDVGHFAAAGQPLMTFVSTSDLWIEADLRENNLANLKPGDSVEILLDVAPGQVFHGVIQSVGFGVSQGRSGSRGELPEVKPTTGWLRQPQRFPVVITLDDDVPRSLLRVGAQATVMVYTGRHFLLNPLGKLVIRFFSVMSYVR